MITNDSLAVMFWLKRDNNVESYISGSSCVSATTDGTSPNCPWSSVTCWLSWRPSFPTVSFKGTTSASPRLMLQSFGDALLETSKPKLSLSTYSNTAVHLDWHNTPASEVAKNEFNEKLLQLETVNTIILSFMRLFVWTKVKLLLTSTNLKC